MQEINQAANPFPGLRPFESSETHLFFGRDGQSEELLRRLKRTRFLAVVGTSGSGKSSLVRAGLLPALQGGLMASAGSDWRIAILRPGGDPIGNLARALASPAVLGSHDDKGDDMQAVMAETTLRRSSLGLVELVSRARTKVDDTGKPQFPDYENLLIVVDQFEELFRFKQLIEEENSKEDAAAFVKLLLEAVSQESEKKIYVVLTMRSDFLGDCSQFFELPEAINNGQYLIPRMTRDQRREAISGPVSVGQGAISEPLVNQLLNDVGDNPDQLPILQHALMRTWDHWLSHRNGNPIDIPDYNAIGGMAEALSRHADEAYAELNDDQKAIAEKLFKGLTEKGTDNREIRRPMEVREICELTGANEAAVIAVIEVFRREGRSFLMPPPTDALTGAPVHLNRESLIDISHESLIRNWERLKTWVDEESRSARIYRRLAETAVLHKEGGAGLWRDPDLGVALTWRDQSNPNHVWARRYHPEFPLAMNFLDESVTARDAQLASEEGRRRKEIKRTRLTALIFAVAFFFSLATGVYAYVQKNEAQRQQTIALKAKDEAVAFLKDAETQRINAETQAGIAKRESERASKEKDNADRQKEVALAKSKEATEQKQVAVRLSESVKTTNKSLEKANTSLNEQIAAVVAARKDADARREEAVQQKNLAVARQLRNVADSEWNRKDEGPVLSSLLAVESLKLSWTPEGYEALARGVNLLPRPATNAWQAHKKPVVALAYSHNGSWLATKSIDGTLKIWDVATHKEIQSLAAADDNIFYTSVSFSPDDRWLVMGLPRVARVWETKTWQVKKELPNGEKVRSVSFSSDGAFLATASYAARAAMVYETSTWNEMELGGSSVFSVAFIPQTHLLATSGAGGTKVWEVTKPQQERLAEITSNGDSMHSSVFSADGRWLAIKNRLWQVTLDANQRVKLTEFQIAGSAFSSYQNDGWPKAFSPDGNYLVTVNDDGFARVWDVASGEEVTRIVDGASSATFTPDGRSLVTGHINGTVREWVADAKEAIRLPHGDKVKVNTVAYSPDGKWLATGSSDHNARVFQSTDWHEVIRMEHETEVSTVTFSPDSRWLITLNGNTLKMFETGSWRKAISKGYDEAVSKIAFSPDGRRLIVSSRLAIQVFVFEGTNWREVPLMKHEDLVMSVSLSPDGKWLATYTDGYFVRGTGWVRPAKTRVWDVLTGEEVGWIAFKPKFDPYSEPKETQPTSGGRKELALESADWQLPIEVTKSDHGDGKWNASIDSDKKVLLLATNTTSKGVAIPHENVNGIDFSPDGHWLATAGDDGTVRLWPLWREGIIREACARLPHNLSREDREKYLDDPNFPDTCPGLPAPKKKE